MAKNGTIIQTKWSTLAAGEKVVPSYLTELSTAITKLEEYGKNVDNCGYTNCCQSCQKCQSCQGTSCQSQKCQSCQGCQSCQSCQGNSCGSSGDDGGGDG